MRITAELDIEINETLWAEYNGLELGEVAADLSSYLTSDDPTSRFPLIGEAGGTVTLRLRCTP